MTDLEEAARQIETAAHAFGSAGPERELFAAFAAGFRALHTQQQATVATQQALDARVEALTAPTQEMRREWRSMAREALSQAARDWIADWRRWRWVGVLAGGVAIGAIGGWYATRSAPTCVSPPSAVPGGVACWVTINPSK